MDKIEFIIIIMFLLGIIYLAHNRNKPIQS